MSSPLVVACVQSGSLGSDIASRRTAAARLIEQNPGCDLIVLPELWPVGYFAFDDYESAAEPLDGPTLATIAQAARNAGAHVVLGSLVERSSDGLHNTSALIDPQGTVLGTYRKVHVFGYDSRETELIKGGTDARVVETAFGRVGLGICYDLRFPELFRSLVDQGAELFVVPAAWPLSRAEHWSLLLRARAIENQAYVVACNGCGKSNGTALAGLSAIIDPLGEFVSQAGDLPRTLTGTIDLEGVAEYRRTFPALADRRLQAATEVAA